MGAARAMSPRLWIASIVAVTAAIAALSYFFVAAADQQQSQASAGQQLYLANCARCHGVNLEGQPNWMQRNEEGRLPTPSHDETGHTWHHSDKQLFTITKYGLQAIAPNYGSDMPAFENMLTDEEITSILDYIKGTWPERPRAYQAAQTASDQ